MNCQVFEESLAGFSRWLQWRAMKKTSPALPPSWLRSSFTDVTPQIQNISCQRHKSNKSQTPFCFVWLWAVNSPPPLGRQMITWSPTRQPPTSQPESPRVWVLSCPLAENPQEDNWMWSNHLTQRDVWEQGELALTDQEAKDQYSPRSLSVHRGVTHWFF